jgi:hypothetical protein
VSIVDRLKDSDSPGVQVDVADANPRAHALILYLTP